MSPGARWLDIVHHTRRLVVKVGTSTLTAGGFGLDMNRLDELTSQLTALHQRGLQITLVTSGAIVTGSARLNLPAKRRTISERQALAAIGQAVLMHEYERRFGACGIIVAQILLTAGDFDDRQAYLNASRTVEALLMNRVLPIVNENDTTATDEIRIGDNDTLSARVATLVNAQLLCILSDVDGLYTADPHAHPEAVRVDTVETLTEVEPFAGRSRSSLGVGGMVTKLAAARMATLVGTAVAIVDGAAQDVILRLLEGEGLGTRFLPSQTPLRGRRRWIASRTQVRGRLQVDTGAAEAITVGGRSLLPGGVLAVEGEFEAGDLVVVIGPNGAELGRGVASYHSEDLRRVTGLAQHDERTTPGTAGPEAIHRNNLVIHR